MKLFTVQDSWIGRTLENGKTWRASLERSNEIASIGEDEDGSGRYTIACYDWIHEKAKGIIGEPAEKGQALIWASDFSEIEGYRGVRFNGQACCKIEMEVPDELVLRLAYDPWALALVGTFIDDSSWGEDEYDAKNREYEQHLKDKYGDAESVEALIQSLEDHFLNFDSPEGYWQYVFWEIRPEWITDIEYFIADKYE